MQKKTIFYYANCPVQRVTHTLCVNAPLILKLLTPQVLLISANSTMIVSELNHPRAVIHLNTAPVDRGPL